MIIQGDALAVLRGMPSESVQCCVTSPPYYGLRSYGTPPLVFGGDPAHAHTFAEEEVRTEVGRGNWAQDVNGRGEVQPDRIEAGRAAIQETVRRGFCACGAGLGHLGLEPTPELFVAHMVEIFREVWRVLKPDGVLWLNLGDSYAAAIPRLCILAGSRPGDVVLDPFNGAGTTGVVCEKLRRKYLGIELNADYVAMAERRIRNVAPLFAEEAQ